MNTKALTSEVASQLGLEPRTVQNLTEALADTLADIATELDSAAVPGFGTFISRKIDEHIQTDPLTGKRTLLPPAITLGFQPSVVLRKKIEKNARS